MVNNFCCHSFVSICNAVDILFCVLAYSSFTFIHQGDLLDIK